MKRMRKMIVLLAMLFMFSGCNSETTESTEIDPMVTPETEVEEYPFDTEIFTVK